MPTQGWRNGKLKGAREGKGYQKKESGAWRRGDGRKIKTGLQKEKESKITFFPDYQRSRSSTGMERGEICKKRKKETIQGFAKR